MRATRIILLTCCLALPTLAVGGDVDPQLTAVREEITRLEAEVARLRTQEGGVLGQLERLSAELTLASSRLREVGLRREFIQGKIAQHETVLVELDQSQQERLSYLSFRLREIYKTGAGQTARRVLGDRSAGNYWEGLRYAAFLNERDHAVLAEFRQDEETLAAEREVLITENEQLRATEQELEQTRRSVHAGRTRQTRMLDGIRDDKARREAALAELRQAAGNLTQQVERSVVSGEPALDMRKFRGLLDWPSQGRVRSGFGTKIHPRFKTRVPHPGLDIDAAAGSSIRSVFDGEVAFSGWMRGYGLTAIVDHGNGLHSVYAHAAVLWIEPGEKLQRGQRLGIVGETGSFSGPSLYFELRLKGQAVDPADWLRPR